MRMTNITLVVRKKKTQKKKIVLGQYSLQLSVIYTESNHSDAWRKVVICKVSVIYCFSEHYFHRRKS